jgi:excisionase family DNA binding protein
MRARQRAPAVPGDLREIKLLSVREVIDATQFSPAHVYRLISSGELPSIRSGRAIRVRFSALAAWLKTHDSAA